MNTKLTLQNIFIFALFALFFFLIVCMMKPKALTSEAIGRAKLHQVHFYWKTARDTLHFDGIASGFAMFLH